MSKWFTVKAVRVNDYLVEVEDNETEADAMNYAQEVMFSADYEEMEVEPYSGDVENSLHHFTEVLRIPS